MTNSKNHAFLNCPTSRTIHLGGTPLESGEAGGQFKKASWVHVVDALPGHLLALPLALKLPCEITRFKLDQFDAAQPAANLGFIDADTSVCSSGSEGLELGDGEAHGLGFRFVECEQLDAHGIEGVGGLAVGKVADRALVATAMGGNLCLRDALSHEAANDGLEINWLADCYWRELDFLGGQLMNPADNLVKNQTLKPFIQVACSCFTGTSGDQHRLGSQNGSVALNGAGIDERHAEAADTIGVLCDAHIWSGTATYFYGAVTEFAGVEVFHGSGLRVVNQGTTSKVRPLLVLDPNPCPLGTEVLAANDATGGALNLGAVLSRDGPGTFPVGYSGLLQSEKLCKLLLTTNDFCGFFDGFCDLHVLEYRLAKHFSQPG